LDAEVEINNFWKMIRENIIISAKEILDNYELKMKLHGLMKNAQN
jgi:hypothetical protein